MKTAGDALSTLKHELEFLDRGGYRRPVGARQPLFCMESGVEWRPPLFFEDSPICPKKKYELCSTERDCVLMGLVPLERRTETIPCRHIPLNEQGETIENLTGRGATEQQIETALRAWLVKTIAELERASAPRTEDQLSSRF